TAKTPVEQIQLTALCVGFCDGLREGVSHLEQQPSAVSPLHVGLEGVVPGASRRYQLNDASLDIGIRASRVGIGSARCRCDWRSICRERDKGAVRRVELIAGILFVATVAKITQAQNIIGQESALNRQIVLICVWCAEQRINWLRKVGQRGRDKQAALR